MLGLWNVVWIVVVLPRRDPFLNRLLLLLVVYHFHCTTLKHIVNQKLFLFVSRNLIIIVHHNVLHKDIKGNYK